MDIDISKLLDIFKSNDIITNIKKVLIFLDMDKSSFIFWISIIRVLDDSLSRIRFTDGHPKIELFSSENCFLISKKNQDKYLDIHNFAGWILLIAILRHFQQYFSHIKTMDG